MLEAIYDYQRGTDPRGIKRSTLQKILDFYNMTYDLRFKRLVENRFLQRIDAFISIAL
jgi:hypothetical protein